MKVTPNLIQGEMHMLDRKRIPGSQRYGKAFYSAKFIKNLENHLKKRYPQLNIDVQEDEQSYVVYMHQKHK